MFPVLGFGAKLPDGSVSHEFAVVSFSKYFNLKVAIDLSEEPLLGF